MRPAFFVACICLEDDYDDFTSPTTFLLDVPTLSYQ